MNDNIHTPQEKDPTPVQPKRGAMVYGLKRLQEPAVDKVRFNPAHEDRPSALFLGEEAQKTREQREQERAAYDANQAEIGSRMLKQLEIASPDTVLAKEGEAEPVISIGFEQAVYPDQKSQEVSTKNQPHPDEVEHRTREAARRIADDEDLRSMVG